MFFRFIFLTLLLAISGLYVVNAQSIQGPATVAVGQTATYTFSNGSTVPAPAWIITKGTKVSQSSSGTTYTVNVTWNSAGSGRLELQGKEIGRNSEYYTVDSKVITILSAPPTPTATFTSPDYQCQQTFVTRSGPPSDAIYDWFWQTSPTGTDVSSEAAALTRKLTSSSPLYVRARFKNSPNTWSGSAQQVLAGTITVYTRPAKPATATNGYRFGTGVINLSVSTVPEATAYKWYTSDIPATSFIAGVSTNSYQFELTQSTTAFYVASIYGPCESTDRTVVTGNSYNIPTISMTNNGIVNINSPVVMSTQVFDSYVWKRSNGETVGIESTFKTSTPGIYTVTVIKNGATATSEPVSVGFYLDSQNRNYILSNTLIEKEKDALNIYSLSAEKNQRIVQYFDELGRIEQTVQVQASPKGKDIVVPSIYNSDGLEYRKFLPFAHSTSDGSYKDKASIISSSDQYIGEAKDFYNNASTAIPVDAMPYAETMYEKSPMNRVLKSGSYGQAWQPSATSQLDHTVRYAYETNVASEVLLWKWNRYTRVLSAQSGSTLIYYSANELVVLKTTDENNLQTIEYRDKLGQVILKKNQTKKNGTISDYSLTYYVYDDYGNLVVVLPPAAVANLGTEYFNTANEDSRRTFLGKYAFIYRYDARARLAAKKIPGADSTYIAYDKRDRVILTQDGNQRLSNKWSYTKYDVLNRSVITGIYTHAAAVTQKEMQDYVTQQMSTALSYYEAYDGSISNHGYTNRAFPTSAIEVQSVFYYDNYRFLTLTEFSGLGFDPNHVPGSVKISFPLNTTTGSKVVILNTTNWLCTANYYDKNYRGVQSISTNAVGGLDKMSMVYDFSGLELAKKVTHKAFSNADITHNKVFKYDAGKRLESVTSSINGATPVTLVRNRYNELGQVIDKKLHSFQADGNDAKQSVDYRYTIQGWLASINNSALKNNGVDNDDSNDLFGMNLIYEKVVTGLTTTDDVQFNGNIAAIAWSSNIGLASVKELGYLYKYDALNRLTDAVYREGTISGTAIVYSAKNTLKEHSILYDLNGNIKQLKRTGSVDATTEVDFLTYTYNGNQLTSIRDDGDKLNGFVDRNINSDDYGYDANGNMLFDKNKDVQDIQYNYLNLPQKVVKKNGDYLEYTYDATGRKIKQQVYNSAGALQRRTDYSNDFYYVDGLLQFMNHEEGRIAMTNGTVEYQYNHKDHLGNVRLTFTTKEEVDSNTATLENTNATSEQSQFINYAEAITVNQLIFDHTHKVTQGTPSSYRSTRLLGGNSNAKYGLAKSLSVMPGDKVRMKVYAKYPGKSTEITQALRDFLLSIAPGGSAPSGTIVDGGITGSLGSGSAPPLLFTNSPASDGVPTAHLNYITFDRNYKPIYDDTQTYRVAVAINALETGTNGSHQEMMAEVTIKQAGFMYIYLSNESSTEQEVYFDDFSVEHIKSPVIEVNDYYPFGLTFNSYTKENSVRQPYQFNGKEVQSDLNLNWLDFGARMYTPEIGRWWVVDPMSESMNSLSPYQYAYNNPIAFIDPDGQYAWYANGKYYDYDQSGNIVPVSWAYVKDQIDHGDGIEAKVIVKGKGNLVVVNYLSSKEDYQKKVNVAGMNEGNVNWDVIETKNGDLTGAIKIVNAYKKLSMAINTFAIANHGGSDKLTAVQDEKGLIERVTVTSINDYKNGHASKLMTKHLDDLKKIASSITTGGTMFFLACNAGADGSTAGLPAVLGRLLLKANKNINIWMPVGSVFFGSKTREVRFGENGVEAGVTKGWSLINKFNSKSPQQTLVKMRFYKTGEKAFTYSQK